MISERKFVAAHSSFWRTTLPMGEAYVRSLNARTKRFAAPVPTQVPPARQAPVSELAFRLYVAAEETRRAVATLFRSDSTQVYELAETARRYIAELEHGGVVAPLDETELSEAARLAANLQAYVQDQAEGGEQVVNRPFFAGCGILDDCEGDILVGHMLIEVKNVDRDFRQADIRQLLCYCALSAAADQHIIDRVAIVNARRGMSYDVDLTALSLAASGMPARDLLSVIANYVSADQNSR